MADQTPHNLQQFTQGKPIAGFHQTRTVFWVGISAVLHVVLILSFSGRYIQDHVLDPAGADARKQRDAEIDAAAIAAAGGAPTITPASTTQPTSKGPTTTPAFSKLGSNDDAMLKSKADTPIVKSMNQTAKPDEIPDKPDDIGISLEDTNKK